MTNKENTKVRENKTKKKKLQPKNISLDDYQKLEKQLRWYKSFFDNATDAVFIVQPETWSVLDANEFAATLLGIPQKELIGTTLPQFRRIFKLLRKSSSPIVLSELILNTANEPNLMEVEYCQ